MEARRCKGGRKPKRYEGIEERIERIKEGREERKEKRNEEEIGKGKEAWVKKLGKDGGKEGGKH